MLAEITYDGELSLEAYIVLGAILFIVIGGLGWCFYRAITATEKEENEQLPDEV